MKSLRTLLSIAALGTMIAFSGCGGGGGNSEPLWDKQLGLLTKQAWVVKPSGGVMYGSGAAQVDSTANWFQGPGNTLPFTLTITGTKGQPAGSTYSYTCINRPPRSVWPASGDWQFGATPANSIVRKDDTGSVNITYSVDPASSNLQLVFSFAGTGYTRVGNVSGDWTFNMVPVKP